MGLPHGSFGVSFGQNKPILLNHNRFVIWPITAHTRFFELFETMVYTHAGVRGWPLIWTLWGFVWSIFYRHQPRKTRRIIHEYLLDPCVGQVLQRFEGAGKPRATNLRQELREDLLADSLRYLCAWVASNQVSFGRRRYDLPLPWSRFQCCFSKSCLIWSDSKHVIRCWQIKLTYFPSCEGLIILRSTLE